MTLQGIIVPNGKEAIKARHSVRQYLDKPIDHKENVSTLRIASVYLVQIADLTQHCAVLNISPIDRIRYLNGFQKLLS